MKNAKRVTVKEISRELGLALGTISKALSGKPGVKDETRELVLRTAETMGYRTNRLAQSLARNPIAIGVIIPSVWPYHYGYFEVGIKEALGDLQDYGVGGLFKRISGLHARDELIACIDELIRQDADAVIMCPSFDPEYRVQLTRLNEAGIPVLLLGTDIENASRVSCVSVDAELAGRIAGDLMRLMVSDSKQVVVLIGNKDMNEHKRKALGFCDSLAGFGMPVRVYETQDEPEIAYHVVGKAIRDFANLGGIYVATGNYKPVCQSLEEHRLAGTIKIIATDILPEIKEQVQKGAIQGVIFQNQVLQGRTAVRTVYEYLAGNNANPANILIQPELWFRSRFTK